MPTSDELIALAKRYGDYSLVVELRFVEPVVRVRFPLVAPIHWTPYGVLCVFRRLAGAAFLKKSVARIEKLLRYFRNEVN